MVYLTQEDIIESLIESAVAVVIAGLVRGQGDVSQIITNDSLTIGAILAIASLIIRMFAPNLIKGYQGGLSFFALRGGN